MNMTVTKTASLQTLWLVALLAGCAAPATRITLLPQEDGRPSAVVVRSIGKDAVQGAEQKISTPYQRATARLGDTSAPKVHQVDPVKFKADNAALFTMLPPKPQRFTLYFEGGGTVLTPESQQMLAEILAAAHARSGGDIVVIGHTDTTGPLLQNDELSRRRAQLVRQLFVDRQFPAQRIEAVGRGKRELAVPTADEVDEPLNRRVTIEVR